MKRRAASVVCILAGGVLWAPPAAAQQGPAVDIWFENGNSFSAGQQGALRYSADRGSYVTVVRTDADGRFSVLAPGLPNSRSRFVGPSEARVASFRADAYDGMGYVFAIASRAPFDFRDFRSRDGRWDMDALAQRDPDPFAAVERFAARITGRRGGYTVAYAPYEVGQGIVVRGPDRAAQRPAVAYDDGYGGYYGGGQADYYGDGYVVGSGAYYGYSIPWWSSPQRRRFDRDRFSRFNSDPRARFSRHCPDGSLLSYALPCAPFRQHQRQHVRQRQRPQEHQFRPRGPSQPRHWNVIRPPARP